MTGEDLAKAVESVVLRVIVENPVALMSAFNAALDKDEVFAVSFVNKLQERMTPQTSVPTLQLSKVEDANLLVNTFAEALEKAGSSARTRVFDIFENDADFCTEPRVKEIVDDVCRDVAEEAIDDKMSNYPDEDAVKELINGAWNGA